MTMIRAHWNDGQVVLDEPVTLEEGRRLYVMPAEEIAIEGMTEEEQGDDPESIERWIAECEAIPPLEMSAKDEAAMNAWNQQMKEYDLEKQRKEWLKDTP